MTTQIHPSLKRLIQQHFEPAFGGMSFPPGSDRPNQTFTGTGCPVWALPPTPLLPFHSTFLMNQLWRRLLKVMAAPAKIVHLTPSWRAVQVTGCAVFVEGPSHEIQVLLWDPAGGAQPFLRGMESHRVILTETPYRILWLQRLGNLAAAEVCEYHRHRDRLIPLGTAVSYSEWIFEQFAHALPKHVDLRRLRQQCAQALDLSSDHVRVAHRLALIGIARGKATVADYNKAVRHADAMTDLNQDAPSLVPLLGVLSDEPDFPVHGEVTAKIRNYLVAMGLSGYVWRTYRQAAKLMHPDRATTAQEIQRRTVLMAQVNLAYESGNQQAIEKLILEFGQDPEAIAGEDVASRIVKAIRRIAQLRRRLNEIKQELETQKQTEIYQLKTTIEETEAMGGDPLGDLAQQLIQELSEQKIRLEIVRQW